MSEEGKVNAVGGVESFGVGEAATTLRNGAEARTGGMWWMW
jgi:hypothetical protein